jgi:hypothetical protein
MPPITKQCRITGTPFVIDEWEQDFFKRISPVFNGVRYDIPLPTLCPEERMRRRLAERNERNLYHRNCDFTQKSIISSSSPNKPHRIVSIDAWWSDDWDPLSYGQDFDFSRPFFEQFNELKLKVPRMNLQQQKPMENSDYCNCASNNKNCYLVFSTNHCEDSYYGSWINYSKDCIDNSNSMKNELCYETVDCHSCYEVLYGEESRGCTDSYFIKNCVGSQKLIFCWGLRNAKYQIFNQQVSPEQYEAFKKELRLDTRSGFQNAIAKFNEIKSQMIVKELYGTQNENVTGNIISNCRNSKQIYECMDCEDVRYSNNLEVGAKDCMDFSYWGSKASEIYESHACGYDVSRLLFCNLSWSGCSDLMYSDHCFSTQDSFGCVGLKKARYCILNKQYSKEEYEALVPRIIEHMIKTGEWGEFFPIETSAFAYNETLAQEWFPLTKQQALEKNYNWQDDQAAQNYQGPQVQVPNSIHDVDEEIIKQILHCETTGKLFKIIPQELKFYRKMQLPIPRFSPDQRHLNRMARRNPRKLWSRLCDEQNCSREVQSTYAPNRPEKVYCEACYLKTIY